jgi:hypothetical protein
VTPEELRRLADEWDKTVETGLVTTSTIRLPSLTPDLARLVAEFAEKLEFVRNCPDNACGACHEDANTALAKLADLERP